MQSERVAVHAWRTQQASIDVRAPRVVAEATPGTWSGPRRPVDTVVAQRADVTDGGPPGTVQASRARLTVALSCPPCGSTPQTFWAWHLLRARRALRAVIASIAGRSGLGGGFQTIVARGAVTAVGQGRRAGTGGEGTGRTGHGGRDPLWTIMASLTQIVDAHIGCSRHALRAVGACRAGYHGQIRHPSFTVVTGLAGVARIRAGVAIGSWQTGNRVDGALATLKAAWACDALGECRREIRTGCWC